MSVLISGALINGAGVPMAECKIYLDAQVNTSEVVIESLAVIETDAAGQYAFDAQKGKYIVHIKQKNGPKCCVGDIAVYDDSKPGTLNDFLTAFDEGDLKPDVVKRFEEMVAQAQQSAKAAAESERQAGQHVADAQQIKSDCEALADNVQQDAEAVAEDKKQVAQLADDVQQNTNALAGKQPLNEILTSLSGLVTAGNKLPYFSDKNVMALANLTAVGRVLIGQNSRNEVLEYLGLKAAATMEPQSDIRDRTPGRVALPGAFGFGYAFSQSERLNFNSDEKFLEWVKNATEGRYFIYSYNSEIFPDSDYFHGIVDVNLFPSGGSDGNPAATDKGLFFYSSYQSNSEQSVFYAQYSSVYADGATTWKLTSVRNLSLTSKMLSEYLSTMAGSGAYFKYPGIGVPVLAVYRGTTSGDKEIKIGLGDVVSGSRLGGVNIKCKINTAASGSYGSTPNVGATGYTFPGRYMALSGGRDSYGTDGRICLFVRIE